MWSESPQGVQRVGKQDTEKGEVDTEKEVKEIKPDQTGRSILGKKVADTGDIRYK